MFGDILRKRKRRRVAALQGELLEDRSLLSGTTIITHGFLSSGSPNLPAWVTAMAGQVAERIAGHSSTPGASATQVAQFRLQVTEPLFGGPEVSDWEYHAGFNPGGDPTQFNLGSSLDGEAIISLDWSETASFLESTTDEIARLVADYLLNDLPIGQSLLATPIHLIGHSRGASLVTELAEELGQLGIWVDQTTLLDPNNEYLPDPNLPTVPENVVFTDDYFHHGITIGEIDGVEVTGAHNVQLDESALDPPGDGDAGYTNEHSDVHLWYHGTIDASGSISDGEINSFDPDAFHWYEGQDAEGDLLGPREDVGYSFSRVESDTRQVDGIGQPFGGTGDRNTISPVGQQWANIGDILISNDQNEVALGDMVNLSYRYQDRDGSAALTFALDADQNPFNGQAAQLGSLSLPGNTSQPAATSVSLTLSGVPVGEYFVVGTIASSNGGGARYAYSAERLTVNPAPCAHGEVELSATAGDDSITFSAQSNLVVSINGLPQSFDPCAVSTIKINALGGVDSIILTGGDGTDTASLSIGSLTVTGTNYQIQVNSAENVKLDAGGGTEAAAYLYDSPGNDSLSCRPGYCYLSGSGFFHQVYDFETVYAYGTGTGTDTAYLYDSSLDDVFYGLSTYSQMSGTTYMNRATGFEKVYGYASTGGDSAYLYDSAGNDSFYGRPTQSYMAGPNFYVRAKGFDNLYGYASIGNDAAYLYDSTGDDSFYGMSTQSYLAGTGFYNRATGFDKVYGYASNGDDAAYLYDSEGDDAFYGRPTQSYLTGTNFSNRATGYDRVYGYSSLGTDSAYLYDSAGNDAFYSLPAESYLVGTDFYNRATGFEQVYGYATMGGTDTAYMTDSAGNDSFFGRETYSYLYGPGYYSRASAFDKVYAYATGGSDTAHLYDSANNDSFYSYASLAYLAGSNFYYQTDSGFERVVAVATAGNDEANLWDAETGDTLLCSGPLASLSRATQTNSVYGFDEVEATAKTGAQPRYSVAATDYVLRTIGDWRSF